MLKVESIAKTIACEDTECIFPHVILWIFCFGGYHVPNRGLSLLSIFLNTICLENFVWGAGCLQMSTAKYSCTSHEISAHGCPSCLLQSFPLDS